MSREPVVTKWYEEHPVQRDNWTVRRERRERVRWNRSRRFMNRLQRYLVRNLPGMVVGAKQLTLWPSGVTDASIALVLRRQR